ncbi:baseplate wedge subunit protein [Rhizobium phage RHph_Y65]|uniref:Baseplate wedge subunit protein n=1 Tax=Rhizobium phage RHph_Y65 TaxID=2509785 RepID=A0A7S5R865_9CAUD|nr:baseplate wedge subunit [Rhizobium phage RHph_Y65]QIG72897.1 baseplate wedge subunit protein [Rhizobium phage RHph_Y65]
MSNIINPTSISFESIRNDLKTYVQSLNDYQRRWKDFYEGGAGMTTIELAAGLGSFLSYMASANRREAYIDTARLRSSVVGLSTTLGYNVNRMAAPRFRITFTLTNPVQWTKETPIGNYRGEFLSILSDTGFVAGQNTVDVVIGLWKSVQFTSTSTKVFERFLVEDTIDNNLYNVMVNDELVTVVRNAEELVDADVLERTYTAGTYFIFGDDDLGMKLNNGDIVKVEYIQPGAATEDLSLDLSQLTFNAGEVLSGTILSYGSNEDSLEKLKSVAPGYFTTKRRLITLADYNSISLSYAGIISSYAVKRQNTCCTVDLAYVTDQKRPLLSYEKDQFYAYLDKHKVLGTNIVLQDPVELGVNIKVLVVLSTIADSVEVDALIKSYFQSMEYKLGGIFSVSGLIAMDLPGVKRVYPKYPIADKRANYNQYFKINSYDIQYSLDINTLDVSGTDPDLGYS